MVERSTEVKSQQHTQIHDLDFVSYLGKNVAHKDSPFEIVRQSLPFGTKREGAGLFFIAYAASPKNFNFMLDNMTGAGKDGNFNDFIMKMSRNVKGNYWYFPGMEELQNL